ncbi:MAG: amidohydrolase, partial [Anaerolineales bacterium]|nr:amidohydrolase [Anaerolineales bacterium]
MGGLIFTNGLLYTQDKNYPRATAIAVLDGRILALGNDEDLGSAAETPEQLINLEGRLVLPGLVDSHFHYYDWALSRQQLSLTDLISLEDLRERVAASVKNRPSGKWILGQGWNETRWPESRMPTHADLDDLTPNHPTILWRSDMHVALANSLALRAARITAQTPDPPKGVIDRNSAGEPTGLLREMAINLVRAVIPTHQDDDVAESFRAGMPVLHSLGLVGLHDFRMMGGACWTPAFRTFQLLNAANELSLRIWMQLPGERLDEVIDLGLRTGYGNTSLRIGHVKFFLDGSQGARTAWMVDPYDDTASVGMQLVPIDEMTEMVKRAHTAGLAVAVHAIGDRANRELINIFDQELNEGKEAPAPAAPHRIEHVQNIQEEDLLRLALLGVTASVQPIHATETYPMIEKSIGSRSSHSFKFKDLSKAGVLLALGSDSPVADPNPLLGLHAAVTRQIQDGRPTGGWYPEQRLNIREAIWGYTMGPALASGQERDTGSLTPGKLADFIVLDR